jgi:hypothetical protein
MDEIHTLREKAEIDEIAAAFQNGFTNGNAGWEETPEYHKDMFREGTRCALALLASRTSNEALRSAVEKLDAYWTQSFPGGPDGDPSWAGGLGRLSDDTIELWREVRSTLSVGRGEEG